MKPHPIRAERVGEKVCLVIRREGLPFEIHELSRLNLLTLCQDVDEARRGLLIEWLMRTE